MNEYRTTKIKVAVVDHKRLIHHCSVFRSPTAPTESGYFRRLNHSNWTLIHRTKIVLPVLLGSQQEFTRYFPTECGVLKWRYRSDTAQYYWSIHLMYEVASLEVKLV